MTNWTGRTSPTTTWSGRVTTNYLLREDGFFLLREDGFKFIREESNGITTSWTGRIIP